RHAPCEAVDAREEHDAGALAVLGQDPGAAKRRSRRGGERHELVEGEKLDSLWLEVVVQAEHLDRAEMGERGVGQPPLEVRVRNVFALWGALPLPGEAVAGSKWARARAQVRE